MLGRLLRWLDDFEDGPGAAVLGVGLLALAVFAMLIAPEPGAVVAQ
ncbi:MAG: hypothetical protein JXR75_13750 [Rhodobacteraceae bacterium]|nr:hypothetical protein [Paracoccaceae bacterium]